MSQCHLIQGQEKVENKILVKKWNVLSQILKPERMALWIMIIVEQLEYGMLIMIAS